LTQYYLELKKMYGEWNKSETGHGSDDDTSAANLEPRATEAGRDKEDPSIVEVIDSSDDDDNDMLPTDDPVSP
jgi:hypothetical protein